MHTSIMQSWVLLSVVLASISVTGFAQEGPLSLTLVPAPQGQMLTGGGPTEEEVKAAEEAERAKRVRFFHAIAANDKRTLCALLNEGMDPDVELPIPAPAELTSLLPNPNLRYYAEGEKGFTGLMLASALGNHTFVKILLMAGADRAKVTKRHKTHALWLAAKSGKIDLMRTLMGISPVHAANKFRIMIDLGAQQALFWRDGKLQFITPISSGTRDNPTPTGQFIVTDKHRYWKSSIYHRDMPYFLRLSCGDFGLHMGYLPGYPASHGCIRLPEQWAKALYAAAPVGTLVEIRNSIAAAPALRAEARTAATTLVGSRP